MRTLVIDNKYPDRYGYQLPLEVVSDNLPFFRSLGVRNVQSPERHWLNTRQQDRFIPLFKSTGGPPLGAGFIGVDGPNFWQRGTLDIESIFNSLSPGGVVLGRDFWDVLLDPSSYHDPLVEEQHHKALRIVCSSTFPEAVMVINETETGDISFTMLGGMPLERLRQLYSYLTTTTERSMSIYLDI